MERLQKVIAAQGYTSRRKAEQLITAGLVKVNGEVVTKLGTLVSNKDKIEIKGMKQRVEPKKYYLFYKPRGVVTTTADEHGRKTVLDYFKDRERLYPVGRLDYDASGLIIITNDGAFADYIMHPRYQISKTYIVKVKGVMDDKALEQLKVGVKLDDTLSRAVVIKIIKQDLVKQTTIVKIVIKEGKHHQLKRMLQAVGYPVLKIKREKIAFLTLAGLKSGEYRQLTKIERDQLYALNKKD